MRGRMRARESAFAIEYAILLMVVSVALIALLATLAFVSAEQSAGYRTYLARKQLLDEIGAAYAEGSGEAELKTAYGEKLRESGMELTVEENRLLVRKDGSGGVLLTVVEEGGRIVRYVYGEIAHP